MNTKTLLNQLRASAEPAHTLARLTGWHYFGDINIEHGGRFWRWTDENRTSAECIEVASFDDDPESLLRICEGEVALPTDQKEIDSVLSTCGWSAVYSTDGELRAIDTGDELRPLDEGGDEFLLDAQCATWGIGGEWQSVPEKVIYRTLARRLKNTETVSL